MQSFGNNFYDGRRPRDTAMGAQVWMGYFQRLRVGESGLFLNFDISVRERAHGASYSLTNGSIRLTQIPTSRDEFDISRPESSSKGRSCSTF